MICRFAAKEAAIKAHSFRKLSLHDVLIERRAVEGERLGSGPPVARIKSAKRDAEVDDSAMISISHDGDYATAVCLGYDPGASEDSGGRP
jgi:holo-[acyl-carrier protein] synthase